MLLTEATLTGALEEAVVGMMGVEADELGEYEKVVLYTGMLGEDELIDDTGDTGVELLIDDTGVEKLLVIDDTGDAGVEELLLNDDTGLEEPRVE